MEYELWHNNKMQNFRKVLMSARKAKFFGKLCYVKCA